MASSMWMQHEPPTSAEGSSTSTTAAYAPREFIPQQQREQHAQRHRPSPSAQRQDANSSSMWSYDANVFNENAASSSSASLGHGASMGLGTLSTHQKKATTPSSARFLWSRTAPEEEEREEEALPSYLSYLQQPAFRPPPIATGSAASFLDDSHRFVNRTTPTSMLSQEPVQVIETKSKELAHALQDFIMAQMDQKPSTGLSGATTASVCKCEPLRMRVNELEHKLQTVQHQLTLLLKNGAGSMPSTAAPSLQGQQHPMSDRVSTLEGRQSAFQSQLAQISKVLGIPVGKQGKNSQIKTLVQTLREEIDVKVADVEKQCTENFRQQVESLAHRLPSAEPSPSPSSSSKTLSYEHVLTALAKEHDASLSKLSAYFDERLKDEAKQRLELEQQTQQRLSEHEEWLQQLEGEFNAFHRTTHSVNAQMQHMQTQLQSKQDASHDKGPSMEWQEELERLQQQMAQVQQQIQQITVAS